MRSSNALKLMFLLAASVARAGEVHDVQTNYRGIVLAPWAPVVTPASISSTTGGAFAATGTWHYALAAQSSLGISGSGGITNVTVATGNLVRITWRPAGGATNYLIYRGTVATSLTERAMVGLSTSYVDRGTNSWTTNSPASTITFVPELILAGPATNPLGAVTLAQAGTLAGANTNETDPVAVPLATNALAAATNADLKAQAAGVTATQALVNAGLAVTNSESAAITGALAYAMAVAAISTNGGAIDGDLRVDGNLYVTNSGLVLIRGVPQGEQLIMGYSASIGPAVTFLRSNAVSAAICVNTNAGSYGRLSRYKAGNYYEIVDSETFTPAMYLSTTGWQASVTNLLRFLTTTTAPTSSTDSGSRGEVRIVSTNVYFYTPDGQWITFPGRTFP